MQLKNVGRLSLCNLTSSGKEIACVVDTALSYKKNDSGDRTNEIEYFVFMAAARHGDMFTVRVPYSDKLNARFTDIRNQIERNGSVQIKFIDVEIKLYAFIKDSRHVSGVKVDAKEFCIEDGNDDDSLIAM